VLIYLFLVRPKLAVCASVFGALVCALSLVVCREIYGHNFLAQMTAPREMFWMKPLHSLGQLQWVAPVWPFWFYWLKTAEDIRAKRITVILTLTSAVAWLFWKMGSGVASNSQIELVLASSIAAAMTIDGLARFLRVLVSWQTLTYAAWFGYGYRETVVAQSQATEAEIVRVAALPRDVSCSVRTVCYLAGKPYIFDPYAVGQQIATHNASKAAIDERSRAIRFEPVAAESRW